MGYINLPPAVFDLIKDLDTRIRKIEFFNRTKFAYAISAGGSTTPITLTAGSSATVTFPVNRFSVAPVVTTGTNVASTTTGRIIHVYSVTATGMTVANASTAGATANVYWQAVQMTSTTADG